MALCRERWSSVGITHRGTLALTPKRKTPQGEPPPWPGKGRRRLPLWIFASRGYAGTESSSFAAGI